MSIFQKEEVSLSELQQYLVVLDNVDDGEMVANLETIANGTYPREGAAVDQNGQQYRWHNFLIVEGKTYDQLAEEYGEEDPIPWQVLYDAGLTSSEFERDLEREVPRGAKATVTVQKQNDEINVLTHELHITEGAVKDRFADQKANGTSSPINTQPERNSETETQNA